MVKFCLKVINQLWYSLTFKRIIIQLLYIIGFTVLLLLDDHIFALFNGLNKAFWLSKYTTLVFILAVIITTLAQHWFIYVLLGTLAILDIIQLCYLAYFGTYLHPTIIPLIFYENNEILATGLGMFSRVYYAFLAVLLPYSIIIGCIHKYHHKFYTWRYSWVILMLFLSLLPLRARKEVSIARLVANPQNPSIYNGLKIFCGYLFNILPSTWNTDVVTVNFQPYQVSKIQDLPVKMNIILVYGESFNYHNQSLYGYQHDTTPNLRQLAMDEPHNFVHKRGIAGAVSTQQSIPVFFNLQREPKNYQMQINMSLNLFKLAKAQGFKTIFISAQSKGLTNSLGGQYIDTFITIEDKPKLFKAQRDEMLLTLLKQQTLGDKNFIVLHQRNLHSPYAKNYAHKQQQFAKFTDTYDNAMLYNDYILAEIISYVRTKMARPIYLFITSDHNELTGQHGLYGHITLVPEGADVPIMLYTSETDADILRRLQKTFRPTHYELGLWIAKLMGYTIVNPNTPDNIFYINGNDSLARYGYIKVTRDAKQQTLHYETIDSDRVKNTQQNF